MQVLRTPEERFRGLGFDHPVRYVEVATGDGDALRMAVTVAGPSDGPTVLLVHGEPTWSFVYRKVIPVLAEAGLSVLAPDLVGFGRSDKPSEPGAHTYARQLSWLRAALFDELRLSGITLVGQDWGGLLGLRLVAESPERFDRVVAANTGLVTGEQQMPPEWWAFREFTQRVEELPVGWLVSRGCVRPLPAAAVAGYDAPFPDERYKAGPRVMPLLVPTTPDDPECAPNRAALAALGEFRKPFLTVFGDSDPITAPAAEALRALVPGAAGQPHRRLEGAGHFLQEDAGEGLAAAIVDFVAAT